MNYFLSFRQLLSTTLLVLLVSCGQKNTPAPATTSYQGNVVLLDEFGYKVVDKSGVTVSVVDQPNLSTKTDAAGNFSLGVPQGSQRLSFTKTGYGLYLSAALMVGTTPTTASQPVTLGQVTSTFCNYFDGWNYDLTNQVYRLRARINAASTATQVRYHRIFFATSKSVSPTNYKASVLFSGAYTDVANGPTWYWIFDAIPRATITDLNAGPADKIYGVIYGDNPAADSYIDPKTGLTVYPALSTQASEVFECPR